MSGTKSQLKRVAKIYTILKVNPSGISAEHLMNVLNDRIDYPVCQSSVEKDIYFMRKELYIEVRASPRYGFRVEKTDIISKVAEYLGLEN